LEIPTSAISPTSTFTTATDSIIVISSNTGAGMILPSTPGVVTVEFIFNLGSTDVEAISVNETINAPAFTETQIKISNSDINEKSAYDFEFKTTVGIQAGTVPTSISQAWGAIDIMFPTLSSGGDTLFKVDLGTGLNDDDIVPCRYISGILPVIGSDNITCKITKATAIAVGNEVRVRITNFQAIDAQTLIKIGVVDI
jgi:hypothetical protein